MSPRQSCLNCLSRDAPALLEAALWMSAEHDPLLQPGEVLQRFNDLQQQVSAGLPCLPASELAQPLVRRLLALGFHAELELLPHPASAEQMWREDDVYDLVCILAHNDDPPVPGLGSAIFLHLARPGYAPTEGCVALSREDMLEVLSLAKLGDAVAIEQV